MKGVGVRIPHPPHYCILYGMNTIDTGRIGEAAIINEFVKQGYDIYMPIFGNADFDMVVAKDGVTSRVEVKTSAYEKYPGKYEVQLRSVRPNRTTNVIKKFDGTRSDILAVYLVPTARVVLLNSMDYDGRTTVTLAGSETAGS